MCVCIIYSYNNEGTIGYKNSNTNIIKNKNGLTDFFFFFFFKPNYAPRVCIKLVYAVGSAYYGVRSINPTLGCMLT